MNAERTLKNYQRLITVFAAFSVVTVCVWVFFLLTAQWLATGIDEQNVKQEPRATAVKKKIKQAQTRRCRRCNRVNCCVMLLTSLFLLWQIPPAKHFTFWNLAAKFAVFCAQQFFNLRLSEWGAFLSWGGCLFLANTAATRRFVRCSISVRAIPTAVPRGGLGCISTSEILKWWKPALWIADGRLHLHSTSICWTLKAAVGHRLIAHTHVYLMQQEPLLRILDQKIFFFSPPLSSSLLLLWTRLYVLGRLCSPWLWRRSALWQLAFQYETRGW